MAHKLKPIRVIQATKKHSATVFFFHGAGDSGTGIYEWVKDVSDNGFTFPHIKVLFPTAPIRKYTPFDGQRQNVWFDYVDISPQDPEDKSTLKEICSDVQQLIKHESASFNIPINRVIVGGFSMGGALSLHLGYQYIPNVAGIFALSSFINHDTDLYKHIKSKNLNPSPLFMFHGENDTVASFEWGKETYKNLINAGVPGEFYSFNGDHEISDNEISMLQRWILNLIT